jgi:very-short-patch-repair endonuclease
LLRKKLVLEIDGLIHAFQIDYDNARDVIMNELGLTVLRISNEEVEKNVFDVLNKIKLYLITHPVLPAASLPSLAERGNVAKRRRGE